MTAAAATLWGSYIQAEARAPRHVKMAALASFLDALLAETDDWHPWVRDLARQVVDEGADIIIRTPLFERAASPPPSTRAAARRNGYDEPRRGLLRETGAP